MKKYLQLFEKNIPGKKTLLKEWDWYNAKFNGINFKWIHIEHYKRKSLEVLHVVVMPKATDPSPIYGFDCISINGQYTMICCDLSPTINKVEKFHPFETNKNKPKWADIFSEHFLLVKPDENEDDIIKECIGIFKKYIQTLNRVISDPGKIREKQQKYLEGQRQNDKTLKSLSAHIGSEKAKDYINTVLFPDVVLSENEKYIQSIFDYGREIYIKTKKAHQQAEKSKYVAKAVSGLLTEKEYETYLNGYEKIFSHISEKIGEYTPALLAKLLKKDRSNTGHFNHFDEYLDYIKPLNASKLKSHLYVLGLSLCYGGQFMAKKIPYKVGHLKNMPKNMVFRIREETYGCDIEECEQAFKMITQINNKFV